MKKISHILLLCLTLVACRKQDGSDFDGPGLNDLFGPFAILSDVEPDRRSIDFSINGNLVFNGELSKNTNWQIRITGATTGASRLLQGSDRVISVDNASWNGGADNFPAFGLEDAHIEVTFPDEAGAPVLRDTVNITGLKLDDGILITSFESGNGSNWTFFNQTTVQGGIQCGAESAKGNCAYRWNGTVGWDWAIGSVMLKPDAGGFGLPANANTLYFNMAFKAMENVGPTNSFMLFWFDEDDNGDGVFDENTEDRFTYEYWSQSTDWDLISLKYADLPYDVDGNPVEVNGNGLAEPAKLVAINLFFLANPGNGNAKAYADHVIFTVGKPYTP